MGGGEDVESILAAADKETRRKRARKEAAMAALDVVEGDDELDLSTRRRRVGPEAGEGDEGKGMETIREDLVGVAQAKRAQARRRAQEEERNEDVGNKGKAPMSLEGREERGMGIAEKFENQNVDRGPPPQEDGIEFTPFNLDEEKREGQFDEAGHFIARRRGEADDDDDEGEGIAADKWLEGTEVADLDKVRKMRLRAAEAAAKRGEEKKAMTESERAELKEGMIRLMLRGESVAGALKRLRKDDQKSFQLLTNAAGTLLDDGEMEAFSTTRDELAKGAALMKRKIAPVESDDMFADEEENCEKVDTGDTGAADAIDSGDTFDSWPVAELKRFLNERPVPRGAAPIASLLDRAELVAAVRAVALIEKRCNAVTGAGFARDATKSSQYYHNPLLRLYYDAEVDAYFSEEAQCWFTRSCTSEKDDMYGSATGWYYHPSSRQVFDPRSNKWK